MQDDLQGAVLSILPERLRETERGLLDDAVLRGAGARISPANRLARWGLYVEVLPRVDATVISVEQSGPRLIFKTIDSGTGVHGRNTAVPADDQIRRLAEDVASAAIAEEIVAQNVEVLDQLEIDVDGSAKAVGVVVVAINGIVNLERAEQSIS